MHPAKEGFAALPFFDEFDLSTVDILLISQYVNCRFSFIPITSYFVWCTSSSPLPGYTHRPRMAGSPGRNTLPWSIDRLKQDQCNNLPFSALAALLCCREMGHLCTELHVHFSYRFRRTMYTCKDEDTDLLVPTSVSISITPHLFPMSLRKRISGVESS